MIPTPVFRELVERLGLRGLPIDWADGAVKDVDAAMQALDGLAAEQWDRLEGTLNTVCELACGRGIAALVLAASVLGDLTFAVDMPENAGPFQKAAWALLNRPDVVELALRIHRVDRLTWWRKRNDLPRVAPDTSKEARDRLSAELRELLKAEKGRTPFCTVEVMSRFGTFYFLAHPDDLIHSYTAHDERGRLGPREARPTLMIAFAYHPKEGALELYAKVSPKLKPRLEEAFARVVLGAELGPYNPARPVYALDHLMDRDFTFDTDLEDCLEVRLCRLRLSSKNTCRSVTLEPEPGDKDDVHKMVDQVLDKTRFPLDCVSVTMATLRFELLPLKGRRSGAFSFDLEVPDGSTLRSQSAERVELVKKYLSRWGIDSAGSVTPGDTAG